MRGQNPKYHFPELPLATNSYFKDHRGKEYLKGKAGVRATE